MVVDLLLNDYFDADEITGVLDYHGLEMTDRKYTALETVITVDTGNSDMDELDVREILEDELLVGVEVLMVY